MITITLNNGGGALATISARTAFEACRLLVDEIASLGEVYPGDSIVIDGYEEDAE